MIENLIIMVKMIAFSYHYSEETGIKPEDAILVLFGTRRERGV